MILSFLLQLLCLYGMTLDCYATAPKARKRDDVLPRALTPDRRCNMAINIKTTGCTGQFIERYAYNRKGKCVDYYVREDCFQPHGNEFETREDCWKTCNPNSTCLENDEPPVQNKERKNKLYYYDSEGDFCEEASPYIAGKKFWPEKNLFRSQRRCIRECKPEHKQKRTDLPH
uniref:Putative tick kunitz 14 n=1 Tax=Amblyomma cajennense TaxID=34607 RepID=A0A023FDT4_AMBCJ